jgi:hypothetical protein
MLATSAATTALLAGGARAARPDEPCGPVEASRQLGSDWQQAVEELRRQLAHMPASDCRGVRLAVEQTTEGAAEGVRVVATASDGSRAERTVRTPESLLATGLGLVMSIPRAAPETSPPAASAPTAAAASMPAPPRAQREAPSAVAPPATAPPHRVGLWLGFEAGGRVGVPAAITMVDLEAHAAISIDRWVLLVFIRDAPAGLYAEQGVDADAYQEAGAGLGVGRRFDIGSASLDVALEPSLVATRMEVDVPPGSEGNGYHGSDVELRMGALLRMSLPVATGWRLTLSADTDVSPGNLATPMRIELPAGVPGSTPTFPAWTTGLRVGATGALL